MAFNLVLVFLFIFYGALTPVLAQGTIDTPCDPSSPTPQCQGMPHLTCVPMYNMFNSGTCRCVEGTFWHPQALECRVPSGGACRNSEPSSPKCTPNAQCDILSNTCTCNDGYSVPSIGSFCVASFGAVCGASSGTDAQCDITRRLVCAADDRCACAGRDVWSPVRNKCLATVGTSSACSVDDDCVENSVCTVNDFGIARCRCAPGLSENEANTCSLAFGAECDPNGASSALRCNMKERLECSATNRTCGCAGGRIEQAGVCRGLAGHACEDHAECAANSFLLCHNELKQCFCSQREETIQLADRTCGRLGRNGYCRVGPQFFDCSSLEYLQCNPIADTTYGRCGCTAEYDMDVNGRCRRPLNATCTPTNHNCVENAACIRDRCTCLGGAAAQTADGRCLRTFDESCNIGGFTNQCNNELGLICVQTLNRCGCPVGQEWDEDRSHCVALVSGNCTMETNFCVAHAACTERGICMCTPGYSQYTTYDRHCFASHGTECRNATGGGTGANPALALCNDQEYLICDPMNGTCACEFTQQQVWDARVGACLSLVGGHCGTYLGEHLNRRMQCVDSALCLQDSDHQSKCMCSESDGMEPDGEGRCKKVVEEEGDSAAVPVRAGLSTTLLVGIALLLVDAASNLGGY